MNLSHFLLCHPSDTMSSFFYLKKGCRKYPHIRGHLLEVKNNFLVEIEIFSGKSLEQFEMPTQKGCCHTDQVCTLMASLKT